MSTTILKKGQMQMMETIGVLFVFFLLLAFGLMFYAGLQKDSVKKIAEDGKDLEIVTVIQTIRSMPELKCSDQKSITENCFDLLSLISVGNNLQMNGAFMRDGSHTRDYFIDFLSNTNITLSVYNEKNDSMSNIPIYSNPQDSKKGNSATNFVPITLLNPTTGEYHFGVLNIRIYY